MLSPTTANPLCQIPPGGKSLKILHFKKNHFKDTPVGWTVAVLRQLLSRASERHRLVSRADRQCCFSRMKGSSNILCRNFSFFLAKKIEQKN